LLVASLRTGAVVTWEEVRFDHAAVTGSCSSCHNGIEATGVPDGHFNSSSKCDARSAA